MFVFCQLAAAHLASECFEPSRRFIWLVAGVLAALPAAYLLARSLPRPAILAMAVALALLLAGSIRDHDDAASRWSSKTRFNQLDRWSPAAALRVVNRSLHLKPVRNEARFVSGMAEIHLEWSAAAGEGSTRVLVENAGGPEFFDLLEGRATLRSWAGGRLLVSASFPESGGLVRLRPTHPRPDETRVIAVAGLFGDLSRLAAVLSSEKAGAGDCVALLGDVAAEADFAGLLAARDMVERTGARALFVPGASERAVERASSAFSALFGGSALALRIAGLVAVGIDPDDPRPVDQVMGPLALQLDIARVLGPPVLFLSGDIAKGGGDEAASARERAFESALRRTRPALCVLSAERGSRKETIGGCPAIRVFPGETLVLRLRKDGEITGERVLGSPPQPFLDGVRESWWRMRAHAEEDQGLGRAFGRTALLAGLLAAAALALVLPGGRRKGMPR